MSQKNSNSTINTRNVVECKKYVGGSEKTRKTRQQNTIPKPPTQNKYCVEATNGGAQPKKKTNGSTQKETIILTQEEQEEETF
jgi:hypothetical protein